MCVCVCVGEKVTRGQAYKQNSWAFTAEYVLQTNEKKIKNQRQSVISGTRSFHSLHIQHSAIHRSRREQHISTSPLTSSYTPLHLS